jgi:cyclopropane fatty-acyl-phospholipid synthase-like methyltransferase
MTTATAPAQPAEGWAGYWETLNAESWLYREQSELYVEQLAAAIELRPDMRVLDFGCGFGFVVELLTGRVAEVCFWDGAENMRRHTLARVAGRDNCRLLDLAEPKAVPDGTRFDLILVNSVVQYMTRDEFAGWLADWRRLLAPGGRVVVSDLIPPEHGSMRDVLDLLRFGRRRGVLVRALRQLAGGFFSYGKRRHATPLARYGRDELERLGQSASLRVSFLAANLTQFTRRTTAMFEAS